MSTGQYESSAVTNVEESLSRGGRKLPSKCVTPFNSKYYPWLEESPYLNVYGVKSFQDLIDQMFWALEILRVDILLEISFMSSYLAMTSIGNLDQSLHIFGYLKLYPKRKFGFDPAYPEINENRFQDCDSAKF